jgi:hypothetical protein
VGRVFIRRDYCRVFVEHGNKRDSGRSNRVKGWHLAIAVVIAVVIGYFAGVKYPTIGAKLVSF